jgi:hypothetical protein
MTLTGPLPFRLAARHELRLLIAPNHMGEK